MELISRVAIVFFIVWKCIPDFGDCSPHPHDGHIKKNPIKIIQVHGKDFHITGEKTSDYVTRKCSSEKNQVCAPASHCKKYCDALIQGKIQSRDPVAEELAKPCGFFRFFHFDDVMVCCESDDVEEFEICDPVKGELVVKKDSDRCGRIQDGHDFGARVGGSPALPVEHPYVVRLNRNTRKSTEVRLCSGVLISQRHVLTAAHCNTEATEPLNTVISQIKRGTSDTLEIQIRQWILHPKYSQSANVYDLAIVELEDPVFSGFICLNKTVINEDSLEQGNKIAGWGGDCQNQLTQTPKQVDIRMKPESSCDRGQFNRVPSEYEEYLTCGVPIYNTNHVCYGDSGGPLFKRLDDVWYLLGIITGTSNDGSYAIMTVLRPDILKWISETINVKIDF